VLFFVNIFLEIRHFLFFAQQAAKEKKIYVNDFFFGDRLRGIGRLRRRGGSRHGRADHGDHEDHADLGGREELEGLAAADSLLEVHLQVPSYGPEAGPGGETGQDAPPSAVDQAEGRVAGLQRIASENLVNKALCFLCVYLHGNSHRHPHSSRRQGAGRAAAYWAVVLGAFAFAAEGGPPSAVGQAWVLLPAKGSAKNVVTWCTAQDQVFLYIDHVLTDDAHECERLDNGKGKLGVIDEQGTGLFGLVERHSLELDEQLVHLDRRECLQCGGDLCHDDFRWLVHNGLL